MANEVFLTNFVPEGQVHFIIDPITGQKKKPGSLLFADKFEADIKPEDIKTLLVQNPQALSNKKLSKDVIDSTKNFQEADFSMPRGFSMNQLLQNATVSELETALRLKQSEAPGDVHGNLPPKTKVLNENVDEFIFDEVAEATLDKVANMTPDDLKALKPKDITNLGADLGVAIPSVGIKKEKSVGMLEARAAELASAAKG